MTTKWVKDGLKMLQITIALDKDILSIIVLIMMVRLLLWLFSGILQLTVTLT